MVVVQHPLKGNGPEICAVAVAAHDSRVVDVWHS